MPEKAFADLRGVTGRLCNIEFEPVRPADSLACLLSNRDGAIGPSMRDDHGGTCICQPQRYGPAVALAGGHRQGGLAMPVE